MKNTIFSGIGFGAFPLLALLLAPARARAAGYEFEGIGARQVARGGAATADAADWTAIYWNPAGVASGAAETGLEIFGGQAKSDDGNSLSKVVGPVFAKNRLESSFVLGSFGTVVPLKGPWGLGAGVYTPLLQGADFDDATPAVGLDHKAAAGILVVNGSLGRRFENGLSLGVGLNAVYASLESESVINNFATPSRTTGRIDGDGWGPEGVFGAQWKASDRWRFGALYRTGARIKLKGEARGEIVGLLRENSDFSYDFNHPSTAALGLACAVSPAAVVSFDVNHTNWRSFRGDIDYETNGLLLADVKNSYQWRNTFKFRLGGLFALSPATELAAGVSYDNYALDNGSIDFSTTIDVPIWRFSAGLTRSFSEDWSGGVGLLMAKGRREDKGVAYTLGGWQGMLEVVRRFKREGA